MAIEHAQRLSLAVPRSSSQREANGTTVATSMHTTFTWCSATHRVAGVNVDAAGVALLGPAFAGVRLGPFVAATALGIIPAAIAFAFAGTGLDSVIAAQVASYHQCLSSGAIDCRMTFDPADILTPQMISALVVLGLLVLMPVVVKRWRARSPNAM